MYTKHGHHIPGTLKGSPRPNAVARCGGPGLCADCTKEVLQKMMVIPPSEKHDHDTLDKVRAALVRAVGNNLADDCIRELQNEGILFRERA